MIVSSWEEITAENLVQWQASQAEKFTAAVDRALSLDTWVARLHAAARAAGRG